MAIEPADTLAENRSRLFRREQPVRVGMVKVAMCGCHLFAYDVANLVEQYLERISRNFVHYHYDQPEHDCRWSEGSRLILCTFLFFIFHSSANGAPVSPTRKPSWFHKFCGGLISVCLLVSEVHLRRTPARRLEVQSPREGKPNM